MCIDLSASLREEKTKRQSSQLDKRNQFDVKYEDIKKNLLPFIIEKANEGIVAIPLFFYESKERNGVMERNLAELIDYMIQEDLFLQLKKRCSEQKLEISYTNHGDLLILVVNFLKHVPI